VLGSGSMPKPVGSFLGSFGRGLSILFGSMGKDSIIELVANPAFSLQKGEKCRVYEEKNLLFFYVTSTT